MIKYESIMISPRLINTIFNTTFFTYKIINIITKFYQTIFNQIILTVLILPSRTIINPSNLLIQWLYITEIFSYNFSSDKISLKLVSVPTFIHQNNNTYDF